MTSVTGTGGWQVEMGAVVGKPTALVAHERLEIRGILDGILRRMGFAVFRAGSVVEARTVAGGYPGRLDLLVAGVKLPDGSGPRLVGSLEKLGIEPSVLYLAPRGGTLTATGIRGPRASLLVEPVTDDEVADELTVLFDLDRTRTWT